MVLTRIIVETLKRRVWKQLITPVSFFFFLRNTVAVQWVPCAVHETHKPLFSIKFLLKMDSMTLFTHLKIILLQYFQFSTNK